MLPTSSSTNDEKTIMSPQDCRSTATTLLRKDRKLRPLVISMGGDRQKLIMEMFQAMPSMESPIFSPGVPQRNLRNRMGFMNAAYAAGLIPEQEWEAFHKSQGEIPTNRDYNRDDEHTLLTEIWKDVPITKRKGSEWDVNQHYTAEFWRKAKNLGRDRAVLACTFAHLIAMKTCVEGGFDLILEDNVRASAPICVEQIRQVIENNSDADLIYFGWLGSVKNLTWVIHTHSKKYNSNDTFPFPHSDTHYGEDAEINVGGTAIWGAFAYWISKKGYDKFLKETLQNDVGSMLWRGKRMKSFVVKPIDKILPRSLLSHNLSVVVAQKPAFFRAPMVSYLYFWRFFFNFVTLAKI